MLFLWASGLELLNSPSGTVTFRSATQRLKSSCEQMLLGSKGNSSAFEPDPVTGTGQFKSSVTPGTTYILVAQTFGSCFNMKMEGVRHAHGEEVV